MTVVWRRLGTTGPFFHASILSSKRGTPSHAKDYAWA